MGASRIIAKCVITKLTSNSNLALLRSAHRNAPTLKSVAVTGSVNALTTGMPDELKEPLTNESWLAITQEQARAANNAYISYCSAKKEGELAIWDFVKTEKPVFTITVLLPALIFGPPLQPLAHGVKSLNYSTNVIYGFFNGSNDTIPATSFPSFVDARDLADAHVKALTNAAAANKRLLINGKPMTYTMLVHALAKVPELEGRLPAESGEDKNVTFARLEADKDNELLGMNFRTVEQTMADTARRILELEAQA
jgi:nucleoside-diphosphate-sugar epimerase